MKIDKELVGASTALLVLSSLAREATYGYRLLKKVNEDAVGLFTWQEGTLYPILHKLEQEGLVEAEWRLADTGRRRKYYHVTQKGRETLTEGVSQWNQWHAMVLRCAEGC
jgi:DNA-binding PadR family transcriptional regulator